MTTYERTLLAYGFNPELAKRDAHVNEIQRLNNRELYAAEAAQDASDYEPIAYADRRGT